MAAYNQDFSFAHPAGVPVVAGDSGARSTTAPVARAIGSGVIESQSLGAPAQHRAHAPKISLAVEADLVGALDHRSKSAERGPAPMVRQRIYALLA